LRGISEQKNVTIEGEINYPGGYSVENKNETIADLITRAGGLSPYAFIEGASLIRKNPYYNEESENTANAINDSDLSKKTLNNKKEFRIGIDLNKILNEPKKSKYNLILENGDRLVIPSTKETVKVEGEVLVSSLVRYEKGLTLKGYIEKSGGFSNNARKGKTYVIYPNGDIATTTHFLFFRSFPKLKPGALILVPKKHINPNKVSTQEVIGVSTGVASIALLIDRLFR